MNAFFYGDHVTYKGSFQRADTCVIQKFYTYITHNTLHMCYKCGTTGHVRSLPYEIQ